MRVARMVLTAMIMALLLPAAAYAQDAPACTSRPSPPEPIVATHTQPPYPPLSQQMGEEGRTTLNITIDETGVATDAAVATSSGSLRLDSAAIDHVKQNYRWKPAEMNCKPVPVRTQIRIVWSLKDAQGSPPPPAFTEIVLGPQDYPADALAQQLEGTVVVTCLISMAGTMTNAVVTRDSGFPALDGKALEIAKTRYRWTAAQMNGKPIITIIVLVMHFKLHPGTP